MVKKKGKSKRITLKDKFKIKKRTNETHRKVRKEAKRDAKNGVVRNEKKKKDPGIPNSWPFKQDLLNEIAKAREENSSTKKQTSNFVPVKTLEEFMALAHSKRAPSSNTLETAEPSSSSPSHSSNNIMKNTKPMQSGKTTLYGQQSRRAYLRELSKVMDSSDVVLQILDARDPLGTRIHPAVENVILGNVDKKMVLVLNKIDLVPKSAVSGWLSYLRRSHPTIALKCGTNPQGSKDHIGRSKGDSALQSSCGVGVEQLLNLLKNYARSSFHNNKKKKSCITVGIIGYPNVGKSSVLNTLKRSRAVGVSPRPGFTTSLQEVVLDRNVRLIDSPGVVFDEYDPEKKDTASLFLKNCIDVDSMDDPILAVEALLNRCNLKSLIMTYNIPAFPQGNTMMFLAMVAKQYGKVLKGGIPDKVAAARAVLRDWNSGKIPYYTPPPPSTPLESLSSSDNPQPSSLSMNKDNLESGNVRILSSFSDEFDISKLDDEVLKSLDERDELDFVCMEPNYDHTKGASAEEWMQFLSGARASDDDEDGDEMVDSGSNGSDDQDDSEDEDMDDEDDPMEEEPVKPMKNFRRAHAKLDHEEDYFS